MADRFTKGPWEFHLGADYACVMGAGQNTATAFCRLYGRSQEVEANGKLITAALELRDIALLLIGTPARATDVIDEIQRRATAVLAKIP